MDKAEGSCRCHILALTLYSLYKDLGRVYLGGQYLYDLPLWAYLILNMSIEINFSSFTIFTQMGENMKEKRKKKN